MPVEIEAKLTHPRRGTTHALGLSGFTFVESKLALSLVGKSPESGYLGLEDDWGRELKQATPVHVAEGATLRGRVEGAENPIRVEPSGFQSGVIEIELGVPAEGADRTRLEGKWHYVAVRPQDMRLSRAGSWADADRSVTGREVWTRGGVEIEAVTALRGE